jgi:hypothetical protein
MISYVLILMVSLATGQPVQASLEGPMSQSWCVQLIAQAPYHGEDTTTRKSSSCLGWPDAQRVLTASFCTQRAQPGSGKARNFDCTPPAPPPAPAQTPEQPVQAAGEAQTPEEPAQAPGQAAQGPEQTPQTPEQPAQTPAPAPQGLERAPQATEQRSEASGQTAGAAGQPAQLPGQPLLAPGLAAPTPEQPTQASGQAAQAPEQTPQPPEHPAQTPAPAPQKLEQPPPYPEQAAPEPDADDDVEIRTAPAPNPVAEPVPAPPPARQQPKDPPHADVVAPAERELASTKTYTGILVRDRNIIVVPKTFTAADCPGALNTRAANGHSLYLRCLSIDAREKLLAQAHCSTSSVSESGNRRYACKDDPSRYLR